MPVRGVRGATTAKANQPEAIHQATIELLHALLQANPSLRSDDLASVLFSVTPDLTSAFPAQAARQMGWSQVPLMCFLEIPVPDSLPRCIRALLHWNTDLPPTSIRHVYLGEAAILRPDLGGED